MALVETLFVYLNGFTLLFFWVEITNDVIWFDWEKKMKILSSSCIKQGGSQTLLPRRIY